MNFVSSLALAAALVIGGTAAAPAAAQKKGDKQAAEAVAPQRKFDISKEAQQPLQALFDGVKAKDNANFGSLLAAAEAVAKNADEKYFVAKLRLEHAINLQDRAAQIAAAEAVIASGGSQGTEPQTMQRLIAQNADESKDWARAEAAYEAVLAANPNDVDLMVNLARMKIELKKDAEALELLRKGIAMRKAAGQEVPETWYTNALGLAHRNKQRPVAAELAREVLKLHPSSTNLRNAIAFIDLQGLDRESYLDMLRLMYASGTMQVAEEYIELATLLDDRHFPGEAKTVLDTGVRQGVLRGTAGKDLMARVNGRIGEDRGALPGVEAKARAAADGKLALSTATAYAGYGDYAKAIDFYKVALEKGGVDANVVNTRLGIALANAGRKAEAEAAFKAVGGTRADLASLWLAWLAQRT